MLNHKGYVGHMEVDDEAGIIFGRILDIRDVITFKGETVTEAKEAFQDSVDDYLNFCEEIGQEPDKPFSGKLPFRTSPERHRQLFLTATKSGKSINAWMDEVLAKAADDFIKTSSSIGH